MSVTQNGNVQVTVRLQGESSVGGAVAQANKDISGFVLAANAETQNATGFVGRLGDRWRDVADAAGSMLAKVGLVSQGLGAISGMVESVGAMAAEGAKAADQYDILNKQVGNLDGMIERVKRTSGGMFSQQEIVQAIATFRSFGMDLSNIDGVLAEVGKTAMRTGKESASLLDSLVTGVARLSPEILDNLQLQVSLSQINEQAAAATGKATSELTKQEQQAAALNLVLGELRKSNAEVSIEDARTARLKRMSGAFDDLWTSVKVGIADVAVGLYDFFDKTVFGASEAEREIAKMADTFPAVLGRMRGAAESEVRGIKNLFDTLQAEARETNRLLGEVTNEAAGEEAELQRRIDDVTNKIQDDFELRTAAIKEAAANGVFSAQQSLSRIQHLEDLRNQQLAETLGTVRQRWVSEVAARRDAEAKIKALDDEAAARVKAAEDRDRARNFGTAQLADDAAQKIETIEADLEKARARRDVGAVKRLQEQRVELKGYIEDLKDAEKVEGRRAGGGGGAPKDPEPYKIPSVPGARTARTDRVRATATEQDPFADLAARVANAEIQARAVIDGLRDYQLNLQAVIRDAGDRLTDEQLRSISDRWSAAQERILDTEHSLAQSRLDIAYETEQRITQLTADEEEKRKRIEEERVARNWDIANGLVRAGDTVAQSFIKNEKARAAWNAGMALLDAGMAFVRSGGTRPDLLVMGAALAVGFAAKGGGGGGGGLQGVDRGASRTSATAFDTAAANAPVQITVYNNAPYFGTPGEQASHLRGVLRTGGAPVRAGGVV